MAHSGHDGELVIEELALVYGVVGGIRRRTLVIVVLVDRLIRRPVSLDAVPNVIVVSGAMVVLRVTGRLPCVIGLLIALVG